MPRRQPTPPERSPEERARAAAERAARRGETAPPPETFIARNARPPEPAAPSEDPFHVERARPEPEPAPPEPEPVAEGSWFEEEPAAEVEAEREFMPEDPFPQATQEFQPAWVADDEDVEWEMPEHEPEPEQRAAPPGGAAAEGAEAQADPAARPAAVVGRSARQRARRPAGAPRNRYGRRILAVLALALIGGALWLINATFQPFHGAPTGATVVTIPPGADAGQIGKLLEAAGVIDDATLFEANATVTLRRAKLRPGKYTLPKGMTNGGADRGAHAGPEGARGQDVQVHPARGPLEARERPRWSSRARSPATT